MFTPLLAICLLAFAVPIVSGAEMEIIHSGIVNDTIPNAQCPAALIDYVIWHELTHLEEMNHSARFWRKLEGHLPGARMRRRELRAFERLCPVFPE